MGKFLCNYCGNDFTSKHSTAKYCGKVCSGKASGGNKIGLRFTKDELIKVIRDETEKLGRVPGKRHWSNGKSPSEKTFQNYFGSYNQAVLEAGLVPNTAYSDRTRGSEKLVTAKLRFDILTRDKFSCQYCGAGVGQGVTLHVDHKIPRSNGGLTEESNLITACWWCNLGKSDTNIL